MIEGARSACVELTTLLRRRMGEANLGTDVSVTRNWFTGFVVPMQTVEEVPVAKDETILAADDTLVSFASCAGPFSPDALPALPREEVDLYAFLSKLEVLEIAMLATELFGNSIGN